jgi:hypothetical protein
LSDPSTLIYFYPIITIVVVVVVVVIPRACFASIAEEEKKIAFLVVGRQGDQIGRNFADWAIVHSCQLFVTLQSGQTICG